MKKLIKKILKEYYEKQMGETTKSGHYSTRLKERLNQLGMIFTLQRAYGKYREDIGKYKIPETEKAEINKKLKKLREINVDESLIIGVVLHKINVDTKDVEFKTLDHHMRFLNDDKANRKVHYFIRDSGPEPSNGNILMAIVKENNLITLMWVKDFDSYETIKDRKGLDNIIFIDDFMDNKANLNVNKNYPVKLKPDTNF